MSRFLTRRDFLRSAGGISFLALVPAGRGLFAAPRGVGVAALPLFTVLPYIQPGPSSLLVDGQETIVVAWQTQPKPADFTVEYGSTKSYGQKATIVSALRDAKNADDGSPRMNYRATLTGLSLGKKYVYRVSGNGRVLAEGYFSTRKPRGQKTRFVAFGDNSFGEISDRAIAYYAYQQHPDFVMNTGDNVYSSGLDNEYQRYFFPVYNADIPGPHIGAPLLRSVPFYTVIANHDVADQDANHHPVADFQENFDSLAYYTSMSLPENGPETLSFPTPISGPDDALASFKAVAGNRFPRQANYSFDYGDAHFLCLDSNTYVDPTDASVQNWIQSDLSRTKALWKFVIFHHPPYNVGLEHYTEQHMRVLSPLFEAHGVDFALHGHEHNYQRSRPLKFQPAGTGAAKNVGSGNRLVPGAFAVDTAFDGKTNVQPQGIIYIVSGAGGNHLYEPVFTDNPDAWKHPEDGNVEYVAKMISDRHSLSVFDIDGRHLTMRQIDENGQEIDRLSVAKL